jgi:diguanylate cyclase (GGDEF)-like protein
MAEFVMKVPDWARALVAAVLCLGLFFSDLITTVEMNEAQLYPVAMLPLYRIRSKLLLWAVALLAMVLAVLGFVLDPPPDMTGRATNRVLAVVVIFATAIAMSKLAEFERKLLIEAMTDPLTGLLNRRHFIELSTREETRSRRHGLAFSVLMLDIDHFKRINDTYGHPVGDQAIKALARLCGQGLRPHDILARYGGEEFVLTLPQTEQEGAQVVAERIRQMVEQHELTTEQGAIRFTVSIGVSTYRKGKNFEQVVERADQALYRAKQDGRNRVIGLPLENGLAHA